MTVKRKQNKHNTKPFLSQHWYGSFTTSPLQDFMLFQIFCVCVCIFIHLKKTVLLSLCIMHMEDIHLEIQDKGIDIKSHTFLIPVMAWNINLLHFVYWCIKVMTTCKSNVAWRKQKVYLEHSSVVLIIWEQILWS